MGNTKAKKSIYTDTHELIIVASFKQADEDEESHNGQVPLHCPASSSSDNESGPPVIDASNDAESSNENPKKKKRKINMASLTKSKRGATYERCTSCNVAMAGTESEFQLAAPTTKNCCVGCNKLAGVLRTRAERAAFNMWLKTGKISESDQPPELSPTEIIERLGARRNSMRTRVTKTKSNGKKLASVVQLSTLCQESQFKCVITGSQIAIHDKHQTRYPYWALSIVHKKPLSQWKNDPNAWSIGNLQAMAGSTNTIKGDLSDDEAKKTYLNRVNADEWANSRLGAFYPFHLPAADEYSSMGEYLLTLGK
ncbi:uncharacterized protein EV154DRAFT_476479 [Mucor mucedo]|uniref:uncharacterized protein n=1 Tax=Mucor mucedo TaxID=29922 RepID=UPI00221F66FA|nr:uncharacterized protein EV154DRAFT_476479 [Mucor mucedo]KAI7896463.1 hypothetical protein EV154DRAFT_476479 [Mucor mucedo]